MHRIHHEYSGTDYLLQALGNEVKLAIGPIGFPPLSPEFAEELAAGLLEEARIARAHRELVGRVQNILADIDNLSPEQLQERINAEVLS